MRWREELERRRERKRERKRRKKRKRGERNVCPMHPILRPFPVVGSVHWVCGTCGMICVGWGVDCDLAFSFLSISPCLAPLLAGGIILLRLKSAWITQPPVEFSLDIQTQCTTGMCVLDASKCVYIAHGSIISIHPCTYIQTSIGHKCKIHTRKRLPALILLPKQPWYS